MSDADKQAQAMKELLDKTGGVMMSLDARTFWGIQIALLENRIERATSEAVRAPLRLMVTLARGIFSQVQDDVRRMAEAQARLDAVGSPSGLVDAAGVALPADHRERKLGLCATPDNCTCPVGIAGCLKK